MTRSNANQDMKTLKPISREAAEHIVQSSDVVKHTVSHFRDKMQIEFELSNQKICVVVYDLSCRDKRYFTRE